MMAEFDEKEILRRVEVISRIEPGAEAAGRAMQRTRQTVINTQKQKQSMWRVIMESRITRLAAAAVITIAALIGVHQFIGPEVAWAEVLENIRNSRTLTFLIRTSEGGPPVAKAMVIDPYLMRTEFLAEQERVERLLGGQILIVDAEEGKALILDTVMKKARVCPADKTALPIYDAYRNFREMEDFSVEQVGRRRIGNIQAVGFKLKKENGEREIMVWADPETKLPVLMEETVEDARGQVGQYIVTDIVFDAELDRSLFSVELPEGYEEDEEASALIRRQAELANRVMSGTNVSRILKACRKYAGEHNGQWPDTLKELAKYGVEEETFVNPRQPERKVGYIYLKPPPSASQDTIVLYEAYDEWNEGINVGYASTRVQFVRDKSEFENQLKESSPPR
ncbi:MAG: LolA family protein [Planctomycetota bacterium]|jgi:outer membrane lipoprotein-sorting protein